MIYERGPLLLSITKIPVHGWSVVADTRVGRNLVIASD